MSETKHGTAYGYKKQGCRCAECTDANTRAHRQWAERARTRPAEEIPHGRYGYVNYHCRCEVCTKANTEASSEGRLRRDAADAAAGLEVTRHSRYRSASTARARQRAAADPSIVPHGTYKGYGYYGCRCAECRAAIAAYWREYRARRASGGGAGG